MYDGNNKDVNVPVPVKEDAAILDAIVDERTGMVLVYAVFAEELEGALEGGLDDGVLDGMLEGVEIACSAL